MSQNITFPKGIELRMSFTRKEITEEEYLEKFEKLIEMNEAIF